MYRIVVVDSLAEFYQHKNQYTELFSHAQTRNIYHQYDILLSEFSDEDSRAPLFFLIYSGEVLVFCALFNRQIRTLQLRLSVINLVKLRRPILELIGNCFLVRANGNEINQFVELVFDALYHYRKHFFFISIKSLSVNSELYQHFLHNKNHRFALIRYSPTNEVVRRINISSSFEQFLSAMKKKTRYNLQRNVKLFEKHVDQDITIKKYSTEHEAEAFMPVMNQIYNQTWQAAIFGARSRLENKELNVNRIIARHGYFMSYVLYAKNSPVAFIKGYLFDHTYLFEEIGYVQDWREHSPGSVLTYLFMQDVFSHKEVKFIDFGYGENEYKKIYANDEYPAINVYFTNKFSTGYGFALIQNWTSHIYIFVKKIVVKLGFDAALRSLLKRKKV